MITIATPRGELELGTALPSDRFAATAAGKLLDAGELESLLWAFDGDPRATLMRIARVLRVQTSASDARTAIVRALSKGRIVARLRSRRSIAVPTRRGTPILGPIEGDDVIADEFIQVMLFDAAGRALGESNVTLDLQLASGKRFEARPIVGGFARVPSIPPGGPSACTLLFHGIADGSAMVPPEAPPVGPSRIDPGLLRGDLVGPTRLHLRDLAKQQPAVLNATNVFQLLARKASVIELEHFAEGSALFRPGLPPREVAMHPGAIPVEGHEVLAAVLSRAGETSIDRVLLTGHGTRLSKERAQCIQTLLIGDAGRERWIALAQSASIPEDVTALLQWFDAYLNYACDPRSQVGGTEAMRLYFALSKFQRRYDADLELGLFPSDPGFPAKEHLTIDGALHPATWGAMFDCIQRALRRMPTPRLPPPRPEHPYLVVDDHHDTYPVLLAELAAPGVTESARAQHWKDLDPLNPQKVMPNGGGWYPIYPGDVIVLSPTWDLQKLIAKGYDVRFAEPAPPPPAPPKPAGPPPLPAPGPRVFDCGAKHPRSPFADDDERRAVERRVEVVFVEDALPPFHVCEDQGVCRAQGCELYDPRQTQLEYLVVGNHWDLFFDPRLTSNEGAESYRLFSSDGAYDRTLSRALAKPHGRRHHLRFEGADPAPTYTLTQVLADGYELTIASQFTLRD